MLPTFKLILFPFFHRLKVIYRVFSIMSRWLQLQIFNIKSVLGLRTKQVTRKIVYSPKNCSSEITVSVTVGPLGLRGALSFWATVWTFIIPIILHLLQFTWCSMFGTTITTSSWFLKQSTKFKFWRQLTRKHSGKQKKLYKSAAKTGLKKFTETLSWKHI